MSDYKSNQWANGHGTLRGRKAFIRKNVSLRDVRKRDYPNLLLISLIYQDKAHNGLPGSEGELCRLDSSEEAIADHFCQRFAALFGLCVTSDGTRDLFLFLPNSPSEEEIGREFDACVPSVDFDFTLQHDPAWRPYTTMLPEQGKTPTGGVQWWKRFFGP